MIAADLPQTFSDRTSSWGKMRVAFFSGQRVARAAAIQRANKEVEKERIVEEERIAEKIIGGKREEGKQTTMGERRGS